MAIWGMGVMLGPDLAGPTLGGVLTDAYSWRWVFYVNVPFGVAAVAWRCRSSSRTPPATIPLKFDWFGFAALSVGLASLQLVLDRGTTKDWFSSPEIVIEAIVACTALYLFLVHMATAKKPFIPLAIIQGPQFHRRAGADVFDGACALGQLGPDVALSAESCRRYRDPDRLPDGAARAGRDVRHDIRRPPHHEDGSASADDTGRHGLVVVAMGHDKLRCRPSAPARFSSRSPSFQGIGMGLVFVPMNLVAFATLGATISAPMAPA